MGIYSKLFKSGDGNDGYGHRITDDNNLLPGTGDLVSPFNPGDIADTVTTVEHIPKMRAIGEEEAVLLLESARELKSLASASEKGYKALGSIADSEQRIHSAYRDYQTAVAESQTVKVEANSRFVSILHGLRPRYAKAISTVGFARRSADSKLASLAERIKKSLEGGK